MPAVTVAMLGALVHRHPELLPVLDQHLEDNFEEFLPHLLIGDVFLWLIDHRSTQELTCLSILAFLETEAATGHEEVRALIALSGVPTIPNPGSAGEELRSLLGPELRAMDCWTR